MGRYYSNAEEAELREAIIKLQVENAWFGRQIKRLGSIWKHAVGIECLILSDFLEADNGMTFPEWCDAIQKEFDSGKGQRPYTHKGFHVGKYDYKPNDKFIE